MQAPEGCQQRSRWGWGREAWGHQALPQTSSKNPHPWHHLTPDTNHPTHWRATASCVDLPAPCLPPKSTKSLPGHCCPPPPQAASPAQPGGLQVLCGGPHLFSECPPPAGLERAQPSPHYVAWDTETLVLSRGRGTWPELGRPFLGRWKQDSFQLVSAKDLT